MASTLAKVALVGLGVGIFASVVYLRSKSTTKASSNRPSEEFYGGIPRRAEPSRPIRAEQLPRRFPSRPIRPRPQPITTAYSGPANAGQFGGRGMIVGPVY